MTFEEFEDRFKRDTRFDKYWYYGLCCVVIIFSLFMLFALLTKSFIKISGNTTFHFFGFAFLLLLGIYGLFVLKKKYKLSIWKNEFTKEQNITFLKSLLVTLNKSTDLIEDNYVHFVYRINWWQLPYEIHLFADSNFIAINVEGQDYYNGGIIDFGASKRTQKKILTLLLNSASR